MVPDQDSQLTWRQVLEIFRPSATVALCTAVPIALREYWAGHQAEPNHYHVLLIGLAMSDLAWLGGIIATDHTIWQEMREFWRNRHPRH